MSLLSTARTYYSLTKPGIIYGNSLVATGGFLFASRGTIDLGLLAAMITGTSLVIASACVINNYIDRDIDKKMSRTRQRAIAAGSVSGGQAIIFAVLLGVLGFMILAVYTNIVTLLAGAIGYIVYVFVYGVAKRRTVHGTLVGSVSGAIPPLAGYTAVTGNIDGAAVLLFAILTAWQMPHFYAIAIYRANDYKAAGIPVLPVVKGVAATRHQMIIYTVLFITACFALTLFGYAGFTFAVVMLALGAYWLKDIAGEFKAGQEDTWARRVFKGSLFILPALSLLLALDIYLP